MHLNIFALILSMKLGLLYLIVYHYLFRVTSFRCETSSNLQPVF